jgi:hypothetical protein
VAQRQRSGAKGVGITHFSVDQENRSQQAVPPRGQVKHKGAKSAPAPRKRAKSVAETDPEQNARPEDSEVPLTSKGTKGGRSGGSRAGLLSRGHNDRGRKGRKPHPLDLL